MRVEVLRSSTAILDTGELRMCDLQSRKFLLFTNNSQLVLWLAAVPARRRPTNPPLTPPIRR